MESYGITSKASIANNLDYHVEDIYNKGYTIIENQLQKDVIPIFRNKVKSIYKEQTRHFSKNDLKRIGELNTCRCPMAYDEYFLRLIQIKLVKNILIKILGDNFHLILQNAIINKPGVEHHQSSWHRDLPYQDYITSKPIAISVYFNLNNYNERNGSILLLPASHKIESLPSSKYLKNNYFQVSCPTGSAIIFNSFVFHKAGFNRSKTDRIGINHVFALPIIKQQICLKSIFKDKYIGNPYLNNILGYKWDTPKSVDEYRINKLNL